jgi:hypothetical protein
MHIRSCEKIESRKKSMWQTVDNQDAYFVFLVIRQFFHSFSLAPRQ